ncbi:MAG: YkgJ family cysteine cluster protein [Phycisphaerales bacterium]|nr:YkgJ family cysteine cluster protein [Phycisphaerales bacterium]
MPWYEEGLSFECTMCGNCCSGPEGYILFTDDEARAIAARLGLTVEAFLETCTHDTTEGRSLNEKPSKAGLDCMFLDRETIPGKAICGIYEDRPMQCRTWPFWTSNLRTPSAWRRARAICPGVDRGRHHTYEQITIERDKVDL